MPDPRTAGVGVRVVTDGKENAFRLRKATYLNQGKAERALHDLTAKRCMELPRSGGWNPRNARYGITAKVILGGVKAHAVRKTVTVKCVSVWEISSLPPDALTMARTEERPVPRLSFLVERYAPSAVLRSLPA